MGLLRVTRGGRVIRPRSTVFSGCFEVCSRIRTYSTENKPFYVTTPIFYVNAAPHVGHLYSMVLADTLKRWNKFMGRDAYMLTGTDEHGMKVQQAAERAGVQVKEFCDQTSELFRDFTKLANVSNDRFMRTTDEDHKLAVYKIWNVLKEKGYIYKGEHQGWYSISDETFYPATQVERVIDPVQGTITVSKETGKIVEWTSEENYFFALSRMRDDLLKFYDSTPKFVYPETQFDYVRATAATGLPDLSVSRPAVRFTWGFPVPGDESQTIYVWLDALTNYITAAGYGTLSDEEFAKSIWPADIHVVGKDIVKFHAIYWPAFLMAAGLALPKHVVVHSHWLMNGSKISKSDGNIVDPAHIIELAGIDSVRYYLYCHNVLHTDGNFDSEDVLTRRLSDLVYKYSNFASRVTSRSFNIADAVKDAENGVDHSKRSDSFMALQTELENRLNGLVEKVNSYIESDFNVTAAVNEVMDTLRLANKYSEFATPWKTARHNVSPALFRMSEVVRVTSLVLQPFMPTYSAGALDKIKVSSDRRTVDYAKFGADYTYGEGANGKSAHVIRDIR
ncbi:tRNA synthetases class I (M)-domain-containing protein [Lipomyces arxii]|uniref:tRNA synthetases class I (M)-domain-containing protein n=1 Tax=Lipomyces arxii TaxID=56418 RepID=UPI0034CEA5A1